MSNERDLDRLLTAWLTADAPAREPEPLLGQVLARTVRTRRRPAWLIPERWIPMSAISTRLASPSRVPLRTIGAVAVLILAIVVGALLVVGSQRRLPAPFGPAGNGRLFFSDHGELYVRDQVTGVSQLLIGGPDTDVGIDLSGDGTRLTFLRLASPTSTEADLWVAMSDGTSPHRIGGPFTDVGWTTWSPSGDMIAVASDMNGSSAISLVPTDGSAPRVLSVGVEASRPSFRPSDPAQILFRGKDAAGDLGLYLVARDGSGLVHLALDPGFQQDPGYAGNVDYYFESPVWSPDGTKVAFQTVSPGDPGLRIRVATLTPTGDVSAETTIGDPTTASEFGPTFVPTGDSIVYVRLSDGLQTLMSVGLAPGSVPRNLGVNQPDVASIAVSPDGTKVLTTAGDQRWVWVTDLASGQTERSDLALDDQLTWQRLAR